MTDRTNRFSQLPKSSSKPSIIKWWPETGSNRRRRPFQGRALPLSYLALAMQLCWAAKKATGTNVCRTGLSAEGIVQGVEEVNPPPACRCRAGRSNADSV
jgi:hypothetical protein